MKKRTPKTERQARHDSTRLYDSALRQVLSEPEPEPEPIMDENLPPQTPSANPVDRAVTRTASANLPSLVHSKQASTAPKPVSRLPLPISRLAQRAAAAKAAKSSSSAGAPTAHCSSSELATTQSPAVATGPLPAPPAARAISMNRASPTPASIPTSPGPPVTKPTASRQSTINQSAITRPTSSSRVRMSRQVFTQHAASAASLAPSSSVSPAKKTVTLPSRTAFRHSTPFPSPLLSLKATAPTSSGSSKLSLQVVDAVTTPSTTPTALALEPTSPMLSAMSQASSFSVIYETSQLAVHKLGAAAKRGDANLFPLLKDTLVGLVGLIDSIEERWSEDVLATFKSRVQAFEVIATVPIAGRDATSDEIINYLRCVAEVVEQVWEAIAAPAATVNKAANISNMLTALATILVNFEFDDEVDAEHRLAIVRQRLCSRNTVIPVKEHAAGIVSNNANANYNFGVGVVSNYNPVNNFIFTSGSDSDSESLDFARNRSEIMKAIKSVLGDRFVHEAVHDTLPKSDGCMPGTRETVLSELIFWVTDGAKSIFWLAGMAGTGKTSVAVTLSRMLQDNPRVIFGGSFFCSRLARSTSRADVRCILPTLAASLADQVLAFAAALVLELEVDDRIAHKPVSDQIVALFQKPLAALAPSLHPVIFVIDALDECSDSCEVAQLLIAIADFNSNHKVKFVLTSRPEMYIRGTPISNPEHHTIMQLHTIREVEVTSDIHRYISGTLQATPLGVGWYTDSDIEKLVRLSQGLFIFASTVLKYVLAREQVEGRKDRLRKVTSAAADNTAATSSLDKIYDMIVNEASRSDEVDQDELRVTQEAIACILAAASTLSVEALADLLNVEAGSLRGSLERLHSVIYVPSDDEDADVRVLHASFGDYMLSRAAPRVRITTSFGDEVLARGCLNVMAKRLHFNVSQSLSSFDHNSAPRPDGITLSLEYACVQWFCHVSQMSDRSVIDNEINDIFRPRLLFWMEVISLLGRVERAAAMLLFAASTVRFPDLAQFLRDAHAFVASSREAIKRSAPHIYLSALPFTAKDSLVYKTFAPLCTGLISVETFGIDRHGSQQALTLVGHSDSVNSVAYSPDSFCLVSGSDDGTVRIWDTRTGEGYPLPLRSGGDKVQSVAFAPDGESIASGTDAGVVCIWGPTYGLMNPQELLGHSDSVRSVTFSPDSSFLASASSDTTIRLWRSKTGQKVTVLNGHTARVNAVAFSPDAQILASCSTGPIRIWHRDTGNIVGVLPCNNEGETNCLSFSPDGTRLASDSLWNIQLWDLQTRTKLATLPHTGHALSVMISLQFSHDGNSLLSAGSRGDVSFWKLQPKLTVQTFSSCLDPSGLFPCLSATFSPCSMYIAVAFSDNTVRILNASAGQETGQLRSVPCKAQTSVAFSADGTFIVSGSEDQTVGVWDTKSGEKRLPPLRGHTKGVNSVAISPDGRLIASASSDCTVRLWNAGTGQGVGEPLKYHKKAVFAVAFSSDGRLLASGSDDKTIRVWDVSATRPWTIPLLRCSDSVLTVAFSPDNCFIAAGTFTWYLHLWNLETGQQVWESLSTGFDWGDDRTDIDILTPVFHPVSFSPNGRRIATCGNLGATVWDAVTCQPVLDLRGSEATISSLAFSPDGRCIATGSNFGLKFLEMEAETGAVRLWDAFTGTPIVMLHGHQSQVQSIAFTSDGQSIVSCSTNATIRVWNVAAALTLPSANACDPITALVFTRLRHGWLLGPKGELLLWVPTEYRDFIQAHPCSILIGKCRIVITSTNTGLYTGKNWTACWGTS